MELGFIVKFTIYINQKLNIDDYLHAMGQHGKISKNNDIWRYQKVKDIILPEEWDNRSQAKRTKHVMIVLIAIELQILGPQHLRRFKKALAASRYTVYYSILLAQIAVWADTRIQNRGELLDTDTRNLDEVSAAIAQLPAQEVVETLNNRRSVLYRYYGIPL